MKHGVIGAGPCGTLVALLLLESGYEVNLFDVNDYSDSIDTKKKSNLKLVDGSASTYDINQLLNLRLGNSPASFYRSKLSGGFSNVWGATWGSAIVEEGKHWEEHFEQVAERVFGTLGISPSDGYCFGCSCMDFLVKKPRKNYLGRGLDFSKTQLAINPDLCECINKGETTCRHGSLWNSKSLLDKCVEFESFTFHGAIDVTQIDLSHEKSSILYSEKLYSFDGITIAAGPIGSSEILLNTFFDTKTIEVKDTLMGYMPFFKFKLNNGHSGAFALSQCRSDFRFNNNLRAHIQLYAHSEIYLERILAKLPKFLRPIFAKSTDVILPHIGIAIIYLDSKVSNSLSFSKGEGVRELKIKVLPPEKSMWSLRRKILVTFLGLKIFPLVGLISWAKPGESYHLGACGSDLIDEFGFVKFDKRVSVAGSLALPKVEPGPITHAAMAQSSRLVERIIYQNLESN